MKRAIPAVLCFASIVACTVSENSDTKPADSVVAVTPAPTSTDTAAAPTTPPAAPEAPPMTPSSPWTITSAGLGPVRAGMTVAELQTAFGDSLVIPVKLAECDYIRPRNAPKGVSFMMENGRLSRVDIRGNTTLKTAAGAGIGDTEDRIKTLYPGQVTVQPHKYMEGGHYLVVVPMGSPSNERIVFETDGNKVTVYRSGKTPAVEYVEGCS